MNFHLPWLLQQMVSERESTQRQNQTCAFIPEDGGEDTRFTCESVLHSPVHAWSSERMVKWIQQE